MEAATAIGVASAAVQFLDFSLKTLALCKEIRDSSDGSTKANNDLVRSIKQLKAAQKDLQQKGCRTSSSHRQLVRAIQDCSRVADELLKLLEHIRDVASKTFGTTRAALRAMKEGKRVERLQKQLSDCQERLHHALTTEMRDDVLQQLETQGKMTESIRIIISQKIDLTHDSLRQDITRSTGAIQTQLSSNNVAQQKSHASLEHGQQKLQRNMDSHFSNSSMSSNRQEFLKKLHFEDMFSRQENIKTRSPGTYDWVFSALPQHKSQYMTSNKKQEDVELRSRIARWLCSQDQGSMFWINGKPGSGKSSLMSYIFSMSRTTEGLHPWAGGRKLHVFSFFFWKPGSELQKTMLGYRRSLLWQLCQAKPSITDKLLSRDPTLLVSPLTEERLIDAIRFSWSCYQNEAIFWVIDGLDECEDDHSDLLDDILEVNLGPLAKICLSSRQEEALRRRLDKLPSVRLQDLNLPDILEYARTKLQRGGDRTLTLAPDVAKGSEGVFLWAVLVCDSLCSGLMAEDSAETLLQRLHSYPRGLDRLFASMFASIDKIYHKSLAFYFYLARQRLCSVALAVASQPSEVATSLKHFGALCERESTRITTQSKGLLEISRDEAYERVVTGGWSLRSLPDRAPRQHILDDSDFRCIFRHTRSYIRFVHRSAYDYIFDNPDDRLAAWTSCVDHEEIVGKVVNGILWLAEYGLVAFTVNGELNLVSLRDAMKRAIAIDDIPAVNEQHICTGLNRVLDAHHSWDSAQAVNNYANILDTMPSDKWSRSSVLRPLRLFWSDVLRMKPEFVSSHLHRMQHRDDTYLHIMHLLQSWSSERYSQIDKHGHARNPAMNRAVNSAIYSAMLSAMETTRVRGHPGLAVTNFPYVDVQRYHLGSVERITAKTNHDWSFVSWYGTGLPLEPAIVDRLKQTAYLMAQENVQEEPEVVHAGPMKYDDYLEIKILEGISKTIDTWQLFSGSYINSSGKPLPLQLSLPMLHRYPPASFHLHGIAPNHLLSHRPERCLRLSCFARQGQECLKLPKALHQPASAIATYQISTDLTNALMKFCVNDKYGYAETKFVGSWTERSDCIELVLTELWNDPKNQLTAWQQLYLRACVKSYFGRFWKEHKHDWPARQHW